MINGTTLWNRSYTSDMIEKTFSGKTYLTYPNLPANLYDAYPYLPHAIRTRQQLWMTAALLIPIQN